MKERPIPFSGPMVRAILDGRKTQTRRIARLNAAGRVKLPGKPTNWHCADPNASDACPYGQPGDRLWVRETFNVGRPMRDCEGIVDDELTWPGRLPSKDPRGHRLFDDWCIVYAADGGEPPWRPSIHMPRWASRILLDVVSVRVERLQQLTNNDAMREGFDGWQDPAGESTDIEPWEQFAELWNRLNSKRATWASNPWVWVIEFRRAS